MQVRDFLRVSVVAGFWVGALLGGAARASAQGGGFGSAVAVVEGDVLVGEQKGTAPGAVVVYRRSGSGWTDAARLTVGETAGDGFGASLATDGRRLLVGATGQAGGGPAAYVFERSADGQWQQVARLQPASPVQGSMFGYSVALNGDDALVGAPVQDGQKGAVHAFRRGADGWAPAGSFTASDAAAQTIFGFAVALEGERALVLSLGRGVYAFRNDNGSWRETGKLEAEGMAGNFFGTSLLLEGGQALVGMSNAGGGVGAVYAFNADNISGGWTAGGKLAPSDTMPVRFGAALLRQGDRLLVGVANAADGRGAIHMFQRGGDGEWRRTGDITPREARANDAFGGAMAAQGGVMVVGMTGADYGAGKAVVYDRGPERWNMAAVLVTEVEEYDAVVGGELKCGPEKKAADFGCGDVDLLSFLPISAIGGERGVHLNDIWGWTDPESGREYALVGRVNGTSFVDITDPVNPVYVGDLPMTEGARANAWRDIKVYKDHAYIVADGAGEHGIQVLDLTRLRQFKGEPLKLSMDAHYKNIHSAHNIVINEETGFAYTVGSSMGGETCGGGLHMVDIREPKQPKFAGCFADTQTGNAKTGYSHDAQCVTYRGPDQAYDGREICVGSNETAISIADVTDKANPKPISRASYPNVGYTHQGWFTDDHKYFFVDDEGDEVSGTVARTRTLIWDLTDLDDPILAKEFLGTNAASDHNLYIKGNLVYQSNYASGLRILDISDPLNPVEVGFFDTVPTGEDTPGFTGSWSNYPYFRSGTIAVSSIEQGVFFVRKAPTPRPVS